MELNNWTMDAIFVEKGCVSRENVGVCVCVCLCACNSRTALPSVWQFETNFPSSCNTLVYLFTPLLSCQNIHTQASQLHHSRWWRMALGVRVVIRTLMRSVEFESLWKLNKCLHLWLSCRMWQVEERWLPELAILLSGSHLLWPCSVSQKPTRRWRWWNWQEGTWKRKLQCAKLSSCPVTVKFRPPVVTSGNAPIYS